MKSSAPRADAASRVIAAPAGRIYRAFLDAGAMAKWRAPKGMTARVDTLDPRPGGRFTIRLRYAAPGHATRGKTSEHEDVVEGRFVELVPDRRIVEAVAFQSCDPAFAGEMTVTTTLAPASGGTEVSISCTNVPDGIAPADHQAGIASTLENLAAFTEVAGEKKAPD